VSAEQRLLAALSAYVRGDRRRAARYCASALDGERPDDALTVRLIHLYLISTELWWSLEPTADVGELVTRAQSAAARTGEPALAALARCMYGRFLIASNGLPDAVAVFSEAADWAAESGNLLAQLETLSDLGHHSVGRSLNRGLTILWQAQALAERSCDDDAPAYDRPLLAVHRARLAGLIGVAIFDSGDFAEAEAWLRRSVDKLRALRAFDLFASISNYLGQLLTEMGRFEEAEGVLLGALEALQADADLSTFQGYNLGLLGKLHLEWGRIGDAEENLRAGWDRLQRTQHRAIIPILRNYVAELLMHPAYPGRDIRRAYELFGETVAECRQSGFQRSEIAALAMRALACLALGDQAGAGDASAQAVAALEAAGTMPALRTEEVFLVRFEVLRATGADTEAAGWLSRAYRVLRAKEATIQGPGLREQFLTRVPTSSRIMAACHS
jgi:tetratricopeptide (TPR) repeat protein